MSANTKIEWCHHTFNPWWGCVKVSAGCANCYAERDSNRYGLKVWGQDADRRFFGDKHWNEPLKWNAAAKAAGQRHRVFCASMADVFEERHDLDCWRARLFDLIFRTPHLDWLLLTKRPHAIEGAINTARFYSTTSPGVGIMLLNWLERRPPFNVWLGTSVENQDAANTRIGPLLAMPSRVIFLSCEPLLGPVMLPEDFLLPNFAADDPRHTKRWVIVGGESGAKARPMHPEWARSLREQCLDAGVPFLFKQWGEYGPDQVAPVRFTPVPSGVPMSEPASMFRVGKKAAGRLLDGRTWDQFPEPS